MKPNSDDSDMILSTKQDLAAKVEKDSSHGTKISSCSSSSRQWSTYKNPRIVRVSRTFGGKDRHSKVCTVRGLRDRRIRLSVPTAIQLYSLQDRLGLSQPSKVVDWLLDATKNEIDKLPPLPMIPTAAFHHPSAMEMSTHFLTSYGKDLGVVEGIKMKEKEKEDGYGGFSQNLIPFTNYSATSFQNPYFHWDLHQNSCYGDTNNSSNNLSSQPFQSHLYFSSSPQTLPSFLPSFHTDLRQSDDHSVLSTTLHLINQNQTAPHDSDHTNS